MFLRREVCFRFYNDTPFVPLNKPILIDCSLLMWINCDQTLRKSSHWTYVRCVCSSLWFHHLLPSSTGHARWRILSVPPWLKICRSCAYVDLFFLRLYKLVFDGALLRIGGFRIWCLSGFGYGEKRAASVMLASFTSNCCVSGWTMILSHYSEVVFIMSRSEQIAYFYTAGLKDVLYYPASCRITQVVVDLMPRSPPNLFTDWITVTRTRLLPQI